MKRRAALVGLALVAACHQGPHEGPSNDVVATVSGEAITISSLTRALARARRDDENLTPRTEADQHAFRQAVLDDLIDRSVLLQAARAAGIRVAPERVDRELLRLKADYPGPALDQALAEGSQTTEELREQTRVQLTIEQYFAEQVFARIAVTDADVEAYYQAHKVELARPEEVHALQIVVDDMDTAKRIQTELKRGERFEELARKYSRSPDAKVGGDLGFFPRGQMPVAFDQACFPLGVGKVSDIVASPYGFHLFKVLEKRPAGLAPLAEMRPRLEAMLLKDRREAAQKERLKELKAKAQIAINQNILESVK